VDPIVEAEFSTAFTTENTENVEDCDYKTFAGLL
jgi:hypothetical protein